MNKLKTFLFSLVVYSGLFAQTNYNYTVDFQNVVDDRVRVELITPEIKKNKIDFYFAKIIPGTYQVYDFGRLIKEFKAFDSKGNELLVKQIDVNTFRIENAKSLDKITYWVDDTYDLTEGKPVSGMSGTNIEEGKNLVLNGHGFYGYFDGMKQMEYRIKVMKPTGFKGASAVNPTSETDSYDVYSMPSFNFVVDTPMMYCKPDITVTNVANSEILVSVYSPTKNVTSEFLSNKLKNLLEVQKNYMGGTLPIDKYAFLMYFLSQGQAVGTGALEHNYSSLYALPDLPQEQIIQPILNIAAHEFFHVITPLNIHSEEIQYFDFNDPDMSKHLWMYEGVTEYFAHHAQVVGGSTSLDQFLQEMANKVTSSMTSFNNELPFTELSEGCLDTYRNEYGNVYQKGALIGWCLDVYLRKYSNGEMGAIDLLNQLSKKFGDDKPFKDDKLFDEIVDLTFQEIKSFFEDYIENGELLPLHTICNTMGLSLVEPQSYMGYSLGGPALGYNSSTKRVYVADIGNMNSFGEKIGYKVGDELIAINGENVPESGLHQYFQALPSQLSEGQTLSILVSRDGKEQTLTAEVEKVKLYRPATITVNPEATDTQVSFRNQWLKGAGRS